MNSSKKPFDQKTYRDRGKENKGSEPNPATKLRASKRCGSGDFERQDCA